MRRDAGLSDAAKVLAAALCDDFAHHETGFCNPALDTLAEAVGKSVRTVQRAIAELREAGWIEVAAALGRGQRNEFLFLKGDNPDAFSVSERVTNLTRQAPEKVTNLTRQTPERVTTLTHDEPERVSILTRKGDNPDIPPTPPNKDKPTNNQKARAQGDEPGDNRQPQQRAVVHYGHRLEAWNAWLAANGISQRVQDIAEKASDRDGIGFDWTYRMPPAPGDAVETRVTLRFVSHRLDVVGLR